LVLWVIFVHHWAFIVCIIVVLGEDFNNLEDGNNQKSVCCQTAWVVEVFVGLIDREHKTGAEEIEKGLG
tara:strand:+ start:154 stop:360 length:207 start_codon:yes stop_codon:yes gene_type:complete